MAYSTDNIDEDMDFHFRFEKNEYFFFTRAIDVGLPITEDDALLGREALKTRKKLARVASQIASLSVTLLMCWKFFFQNSSMTIFLWWIPTLVLGIAFYVIAVKSALRPFEIRLFKHLGWKRRGIQKALFNLGVIAGRNFLLLLMMIALLLRGISGYFGWIEWNTSWSSDFEGVLFMLIPIAIISIMVISSAIIFEPPE